MKHQYRINPERCEPVEPLRQSLHQERRLLGAEHLHRMRVEGHHGGDIPGSARLFDNRSQDDLMPQVQAVEVPDGNHGAASRWAILLSPLRCGMQHGESAHASTFMPALSQADLEAESIVSHLHVGKAFADQPFVRFFMGQVVGDVCEPRATRLQFGD